MCWQEVKAPDPKKERLEAGAAKTKIEDVPGDSKAAIDIPASTFGDSSVSLEVVVMAFDNRTTPVVNENTKPVGGVLKLEATASEGQVEYKEPVTITLSLSKAGIAEFLAFLSALSGRRTAQSAELSQHYFHSTQRAWLPLSGSSFDENTGTVTGDVPIDILNSPHFSGELTVMMQISSQSEEADKSPGLNADGGSAPSASDSGQVAAPEPSPVDIMVRNSWVILDGSTPTLLIDGSNSHSVRIPVGSFPAHTLLSIDRLDPTPSSITESAMLQSDVLVLAFNDTATGDISINMNAKNRRNSPETSRVHLHWLDQVGNSWKGICSQLRDSRVSAEVKLEVLNDKSFVARSEQCHRDLAEICGTTRGGVFALLIREDDDPCQPMTDSGSVGVAAAVVVSLLLLVCAAAFLYYKFYRKRGNSLADSEQKDGSVQADGISGEDGQPTNCDRDVEAEGQHISSEPEISAQVGYLHSLHPVHENTDQDVSQVKRLKSSRAMMWWIWRGSVKVFEAWVRFVDEKRCQKSQAEQFDSFVGRVDPASPRLVDGASEHGSESSSFVRSNPASSDAGSQLGDHDVFDRGLDCNDDRGLDMDREVNPCHESTTVAQHSQPLRPVDSFSALGSSTTGIGHDFSSLGSSAGAASRVLNIAPQSPSQSLNSSARHLDVHSKSDLESRMFGGQEFHSKYGPSHRNVLQMAEEQAEIFENMR